MRFILILVTVAACLWSGYWLVGSNALERSFTAWFDDRRAEGWQADTSSINVQGFPNRFDTILTDVALADPSSGLAWEAPFFQLLTLSYKPNHVIAVWPNEQRLRTPVETYTIRSSEMQGSLVLGAATTLPLDRSTFVIDALEVEGDGWTTRAEALRFAIHNRPETDAVYDLGLEATELRPSDPLRRQLDPAGLLPEVLQTVRLDAELVFDAPWDIRAIEQRRPQPTGLDLREFKAGWGDLQLRAVGRLDIDEFGRPSGRVDVRAENWREMLAVLRRADVAPANLLDLAERGLEGIAGLTGSEEAIDIPLTFRGGLVTIGIIPLGPAPLFRLR